MKKSADYSTTIIYKITCKDPNVTDKYVGHTTDIVRRRHSHKNSVCNDKCNSYDLKLYKVIRENGGWDNWKMEIVAYYDCNNLNEAKEKEQQHYLDLKATLNSIEPMKHKQIKTNDHIETQPDKYYCESCDFTCGKLSNWNSHLLTRKHDNRTAQINKTDEPTESAQSKFTCERCNKEYKARNSLWYHQQKCKLGNEYMIQCILNETKELRNFIIEQSKINADLINKAIESNKTTIINQTNIKNNN
jgi:hypothetical protein